MSSGDAAKRLNEKGAKSYLNKEKVFFIFLLQKNIFSIAYPKLILEKISKQESCTRFSNAICCKSSVPSLLKPQINQILHKAISAEAIGTSLFE